MPFTATAGSILQNKRPQIWTVEPEASVFDALELMASKDIGALLVMSGEQLLGTVSERDYARKVILLGKSSRETTVSEIMRPPDSVVNPETPITECMQIMTEARKRHLAVLEGTRVVGVLSMGDMVNWIISEQEEDIRRLHAYVAGSYPA